MPDDDLFFNDRNDEPQDAQEHSKKTNSHKRKQLVELRRRAEDRLMKKRIKDELGYGKNDDLPGLDF